MSESAAWPIDVALEAALGADAALIALLNPGGGDAVKVYNGKAPQETGEPYLVLGDTAEDRANTFGRAGNSGEQTIDIWCPAGEGFRRVKQIYGEMKRILDGKRLVLDGHTMVLGALRLVTILNDPSGSAHGVAFYSARTQNG